MDYYPCPFVDVDSRDFRAWYGLGQTHEMLKMHHYSLHYFQQALRLRPNDSRMLMAVGCAYQKLNKPQEAKICFWKAHMLGDPEGVALCSLAKYVDFSIGLQSCYKPLLTDLIFINNFSKFLVSSWLIE